jgi:DNA-binding NarL/FixJ family response regulator
MAETVLLVLPAQLRREGFDELVLDLIEGTSAAENGPSRVLNAATQAEAAQHLRHDRVDLIVTHLHIPARRKTPLDRREERGMELLSSLRAEGETVPGIVLADTIDGGLYAKARDCAACGKSSLPKRWLDLRTPRKRTEGAGRMSRASPTSISRCSPRPSSIE